ncbi:Pyridoxine 4-dehydrogenase [Cladochytrium tenue]|nr:Pyridoxine 4-dehydrogenase [Cladochytrium tenue]
MNVVRVPQNALVVAILLAIRGAESDANEAEFDDTNFDAAPASLSTPPRGPSISFFAICAVLLLSGAAAAATLWSKSAPATANLTSPGIEMRPVPTEDPGANNEPDADDEAASDDSDNAGSSSAHLMRRSGFMWDSWFESARRANDHISLAGKTAVVLGGTGTVGLGIATRLLELGANVVIVGRNDAATRHLQPLPGSTLRFVCCDASLLADARAAVEKVKAVPEIAEVGLDFLVVVSGIYADHHEETSEGRDRLMAITFWTRMVFVIKLMPQLARRSGCVICPHRGTMDSRVMQPVDLNDLDMKRSAYSFFTVTPKAGQLIDAVFKELTRRNPTAGVRFVHTHPGIILKPGFDEWPLLVRSGIRLFGPLIARTAAQNADVSVQMLLHPATSPSTSTAAKPPTTFEVRDGWGNPGKMTGWVEADDAAAAAAFEAVLRAVGSTGFGLMGLGFTPIPDDKAFAVLRRSLELGANFWNSGEFYGAPDPTLNLQMLNRYFTAFPEDADRVVLSVKGGMKLTPEGRPLAPDGSPEGVRRSINNILRILDGKKKIDIFECARVDPAVPIEVTVAAIAEFVREGKVGAIGLSEASAATLRRAHAVHPIAALEMEVSIVAREVFEPGPGASPSIAATCAELGVPIVAYSPLGRGLLAGRWTRVADVPPSLQFYSPRFRPENFDLNMQLTDRLRAVAGRKGISLAQLALGWVRAISGAGTMEDAAAGRPTMLPLPGATSVERLEENLAAVVLTPEELQEVEAIAASCTIHGTRYNEEQMQHLIH